MLPRYPIYIPSKGRTEMGQALTIRSLLRDEIPFHVVVEEEEAPAYVALAGEERVLTLPFSNLGQGSIPARNWIRDHAEATGAARHWQLDDNMQTFYRLWQGRRIPCDGAVALRVCEDLTDRYLNVGVSGLAYDMFVPSHMPPYFLNVHVYSCTLINHAMPCRWRGRLNEDTDLCLQALTSGWATVLLNAFMTKKKTTMMMAGGNTDELYGEADATERATDTLGRYEMARSLEAAWPGLVKVTRKFNRYQHSVNWGAFDIPLRPRDDLPALPGVDEYGLTLRAIRAVRSERIEALQAGYRETLQAATAYDEFWHGVPAFIPYQQPPKLRLTCATPAERDALVGRLEVTVDKRFQGKGWSAWWPPRGRDDPASLRWERQAA